MDQWLQLPTCKCRHHLWDQLKSPPQGSCWALGKEEKQNVKRKKKFLKVKTSVMQLVPRELWAVRPKMKERLQENPGTTSDLCPEEPLSLSVLLEDKAWNEKYNKTSFESNNINKIWGGFWWFTSTTIQSNIKVCLVKTLPLVCVPSVYGCELMHWLVYRLICLY